MVVRTLTGNNTPEAVQSENGADDFGRRAVGLVASEPITCFGVSPPVPGRTDSPSRVLLRHERMVGRGNLSNALREESGPLSEVLNINAHHRSQGKSPAPRCPLRTTDTPAHCEREPVAGPVGRLGLDVAHQSCHGEHGPSASGGEFNSEVDLSTVPRSEYERVERERRRYVKMYEHQKTLYEEMSARQVETYRELQEKIIEVVALSTRNEENKRLIRQLKCEMSDNRARMMAVQNRALEETKLEKSAKEQYELQLRENAEKHNSLMEQQKTKIAGLESLLKDITALKGESEQLQVFQLDALLKAAYAKNSALFGDMLRQGKQIDMLFRDKASLEQQLEQERREKRELEEQWAEERYRVLDQMARCTAQIAEQQRSILGLRQTLSRGTASTGIGSWEVEHSNQEYCDDGTDSTSSGSSDSSSDDCVDPCNELAETHDDPYAIGGNREVKRVRMSTDEVLGSTSPQKSRKDRVIWDRV